MKVCAGCGLRKQLSGFNKSPIHAGGYYSRCKACRYERQKYWAANNREKRREECRSRRASNPQHYRDMTNQWRRNNLSYDAARQRTRKALQRKAIPAWADKEKINFVYKKASELGFSVDHVVPLKSAIVCGLHCPENLQLLDPKLNSGKGNRHWPDMP